MIERLKETLEEHKVNVEALDCMTDESVKNLYKHLVKEVEETLEQSE